MDTADDEHQEPGGGDDTERPDIRVDLPSPEEQQNNIEEAEGTTAGVGTPSAFSPLLSDLSVPQEFIDDELCRGSGFQNGKYRIYEHFQNNHTRDENIQFLKKEFGIGGHSPLGGSPYNVNHDGKGLHFALDYSGDKITLKWPVVSKRIGELIALDRYLNPKEKEWYPDWLANEEKRRQLQAEEALAREILSREPAPNDTTEYRYEYHLGDTVYIGSHEYEVLSFDKNTVLLYDTEYPLFNKEMSRDEFDRKIAENPVNEHLRVENDPTEQLDPHDSFTLTEHIRNELLERGLAVSDELIETGIMEYRARGGRDNDVQDIGDFIENEFLSEDEGLNLELGSEGLEEYTPAPGDRYEIQGRMFVVDSVDVDYDKVSLRDITFQSNVGFPIFRSETVDFICMYDPIREEESEPEPQEPVPVGRLDFLDDDGTIAESLEFTDEEEFIERIRYEDDYGAAFSIVVYCGGAGGGNLVNTNQFIEDINPARSLSYENAPERQPIENPDDLWYRVGDTVYITGEQVEITNISEQDGIITIRDVDGDLRNENAIAFEAHLTEDDRNDELRHNRTVQDTPPIIPAWEQKKKPARVNYFDAFPDVPMSERHNFKITDDNLGAAGAILPKGFSAKSKFRANMNAIHLLHSLELDGKLATPAEQEILSRYVGWGSLAQAFDPDNALWADEFLELQTTLGTEEYESARATTLNAHYTSPVVIKAIYKAVENMGFKTGNILDPGCGIGNFQGLLPDSMADSKVYGIEIDPITGRICQQLYQKNSIAIQGYEKTPLPDSFFDLAIGNVPFGGYGVSDKKYDKYKFKPNISPCLENPNTVDFCPEITVSPRLDYPNTVNPNTDNPTEQNTKIQNTYITNDTIDMIRTEVRENIEYDIIAYNHPKDTLDELVELVVETVCTSNEMVWIAKNKYPAAFAKERLMKLNSEHIGYVLDCIAKTDKKIGNIKAYVLTCMFNAPVTIDSYYSALVRHDMYHPRE